MSKRKIADDKQTAFGLHLQFLRTCRGWTLDELAERSNVDPSYINKMETGRMKPPRILVIEALAQALDVEAETLLCFSGRIPLSLQRQLLVGNSLLGKLLERLSVERLPDWCYQEMITQVEEHLFMRKSGQAHLEPGPPVPGTRT
jgi:transcriptional regulator with XRE-family HTH domain